MSNPQAGQSVLILVANGVDEVQLTEVQRGLTKAGIKFCTAAPEQGLVNSWHGAAWGHYFPVDRGIGEVLGSDFEFLVLPGGERAMNKLKLNLHTRRIVNHFFEAGKTIAAIGEGVGLLTLAPRCAGQSVAATPSITAEVTAAQMTIASDPVAQDGDLLTAQAEALPQWLDALLAEMGGSSVVQAAA